MCKYPFVKQGQAFGCGRCHPCRINKRRLWTLRIMLESMLHEQNSFLTLTYDDDHLPEDLSLQPDDTKNWLKRLRLRLDDRKIKYFLVGEYGEKNMRPHYHVALFNYPHCKFGRPPTFQPKTCKCSHCQYLTLDWDKGMLYNGELTTDSAQYVAGYVMKKLTSRDDPRLMAHQHPEFTRMSNRPHGIGAGALNEIIKFLKTPTGSQYILTHGDVPPSVKIGGKTWPLGRYLRGRLRHHLFGDTKCPEIVQRILEQDHIEKVHGPAVSFSQRILPISERLADLDKQSIANLESKENILQQRKLL